MKAQDQAAAEEYAALFEHEHEVAADFLAGIKHERKRTKKLVESVKAFFGAYPAFLSHEQVMAKALAEYEGGGG